MILKQSPEDFIVEEIPLHKQSEGWDDAGPYAVFRLKKTDLNTEQCMEIISKRFHILSSNIKYSGTKDRHAVTTQYISIPNSHGIEGIKIDEENIKLEHVGYSEEPLSLGTLKGNRFVITLREFTREEMSSLEHKSKKYQHSKNQFIVPNYFDEQRFSSNNYNIGLSILKKDYKAAVKFMCESSSIYADTVQIYLAAHPNDYVGALKHIPKKTLLMFIHAVQSQMFNEALGKILSEYATKNGIKHINIEYSIGKFVFYNDCDYPKNEYDNGGNNNNNDNSLELVGFNTENIDRHIKHFMDRLGINPRDFIIRALPDLSVEGTTRKCFVGVESLEIEILEDRAILEFELPKGSYATIVVKALLSSNN